MKMTNDGDLTVLDAVLREDLPSFIQRCFYTVAPGQIYLHNWHIEVLAWHLAQVYRGAAARGAAR